MFFVQFDQLVSIDLEHLYVLFFGKSSFGIVEPLGQFRMMVAFQLRFESWLLCDDIVDEANCFCQVTMLEALTSMVEPQGLSGVLIIHVFSFTGVSTIKSSNYGVFEPLLADSIEIFLDGVFRCQFFYQGTLFHIWILSDKLIESDVRFFINILRQHAADENVICKTNISRYLHQIVSLARCA